MLERLVRYKIEPNNDGSFILSVADGDTFWETMQKSRKISYMQLAKELNVDKSYLRKCLSGQIIPSTNLNVQLCDYFDVDYAVGATEFNTAHNDWLVRHPGQFKKRSYVRHRKFDTSMIKQEDAPIIVPNVEPPNDVKSLIKIKPNIAEILRKDEEENENPAKSYLEEKSQQASRSILRRKEIMETIYGNIPMDSFISFIRKPYNFHSQRILEFIYGVADYDTYRKVFQILKKYSDIFPL